MRNFICLGFLASCSLVYALPTIVREDDFTFNPRTTAPNTMRYSFAKLARKGYQKSPLRHLNIDQLDAHHYYFSKVAYLLQGLSSDDFRLEKTLNNPMFLKNSYVGHHIASGSDPFAVTLNIQRLGHHFATIIHYEEYDYASQQSIGSLQPDNLEPFQELLPEHRPNLVISSFSHKNDLTGKVFGKIALSHGGRNTIFLYNTKRNGVLYVAIRLITATKSGNIAIKMLKNLEKEESEGKAKSLEQLEITLQQIHAQRTENSKN